MKISNSEGKKKDDDSESDDQEVEKKTSKTMKGGKVSAKKKTKSGSKTKAKAVSKSKKSNKKTESGKKASGSKNAKKKPGATKGEPRYFKLIDPSSGKSHGRYTGDTPKQAASKGFTKMLQKLKIEGKKAPKQSTIFLRESTRGSARKIYGYEAARQKLPEPQELIIMDKVTGKKKTIVYHYRNKILKVPVPEQIGGAKVVLKKVNGSKGKKNTKKQTKSGKVGSKKESSGKSTAATNKKSAKGKGKGKSKHNMKASSAKTSNAKTSNAKASSSR